MLPVDTTWFDADLVSDPQKYLARPEFIRFQEIAGVDFMDLKSHDSKCLQTIQEKLAGQSVLFNEVHEHAGSGVSSLSYIQNLSFSDKLSLHRRELSELVVKSDIFFYRLTRTHTDTKVPD
ncbi:MAG: hypothetical protein U9R69_08675 [Thermodesulfobacteriota bacterium]|nr:hypothetical protein [Thermodesulfobacteriota bacterium]